MRPDDVDALVAAYRSGADPDGEGGAEVRLVPITEVEGNGWDLNIGRYIKGAAAEVIDVETALAQLAVSPAGASRGGGETSRAAHRGELCLAGER